MGPTRTVRAKPTAVDAVVDTARGCAESPPRVYAYRKHRRRQTSCKADRESSSSRAIVNTIGETSRVADGCFITSRCSNITAAQSR